VAAMIKAAAVPWGQSMRVEMFFAIAGV
jgi:hypothetical protein